MRFLLLLLAGLAASVSGQQCSSSNCRTCLSDPQCVYFADCAQCAFPGNSPCGLPTSSAANCPVIPTAVEAAAQLSSAYWLVSIAIVAAGVLVALLYSPVEKLCGQRQPLAAHGGFRFGSPGIFLLLSCWCLWFGFSLCLSAPLLPWLNTAPTNRPYSFYAATAFDFYICDSLDGTAASKFCTSTPTLAYMDANQYSSAVLQYGERALTLGAVTYIAGIGLLLPCVLMASLAAYRLRRFEKTGAAPYTSGCSPTSLPVAQALGWSAFIIFSVVVFVGTSLSSEAAGLLNNAQYFSGTVEYSLMPGQISAGLSMTFQLVGLILLAVVSRSLSSVHGVGCNGGGCCRLAFDDGGLDPAAPAYVPPQDGAPLLAARAPAVPAYTQPSDGGSQLSVGSA